MTVAPEGQTPKRVVSRAELRAREKTGSNTPVEEIVKQVQSNIGDAGMSAAQIEGLRRAIVEAGDVIAAAMNRQAEALETLLETLSTLGARAAGAPTEEPAAEPTTKPKRGGASG